MKKNNEILFMLVGVLVMIVFVSFIATCLSVTTFYQTKYECVKFKNDYKIQTTFNGSIWYGSNCYVETEQNISVNLKDFSISFTVTPKVIR